MNLEELVNLIKIRDYIYSANYNFERKSITYLNELQILLDKKILNLLESEETKEYLNHKDIKAVVQNIANINNIKSGLKK